MSEEGNPYIRFDVFLVVCFLAMNIFEPINRSVFSDRGRNLIGETHPALVNASAILDEVSTNQSKASILEPTTQAQGVTTWFFGYLVYVYRFGVWATSNLWNMTAGLPSYMSGEYGIPGEWSTPIGSIIGFMNFIGIIQLLTGFRI